MSCQLIRSFDPEQKTYETGVIKMQLWCLYKPCIHGFKKRLQSECNVTALKYGYPGFYRIVRYAEIGSNLRKVQKLSSTTGHQLEESMKRGNIRHIQNLADIALNICSHVCRAPVPDRNISVIDCRITTRMHG